MSRPGAAMPPTTEAGKRLYDLLESVTRRSIDTSFPNDDDDIAAVEAEARAQALDDVRREVEGLATHTRRNGFASGRLWVERRDVFRALDRLAEAER